MVRILSGWSNPGGSTTAFINLTNALNGAGYETVFMGPHSWHLNKCRAEQYSPNSRLGINKNDILIVHFRSNFVERPPIKGFFLSCHEQDIFPLVNIKYDIFDKIHYVSEHQRRFHGLEHPYFIIPNILDDNIVRISNKLNGKIGGVIGSIDYNKQTHISIKRALFDNCEKVLIYGSITDWMYWQNEVRPLVDGNRVIYKGFEENKQKMYQTLTDVYQDSIKESWGYIKAECYKTGIQFHGNSSTDDSIYFEKKDIINEWIRELNL